MSDTKADMSFRMNLELKEQVETFTVKHINKNVAKLSIDIYSGEFYGFEIINFKEMPVLGDKMGYQFKKWFENRSIPSGRDDLNKILKKAGCETPQELLVKNFALSLSDSYWICPESIDDLTWEQVNPYDNFSSPVIFHDGTGRAYYSNPSGSLNGSLAKEAVRQVDGWHLIKHDGSGSGEGLMNINEKFASDMYKRLGLTEYTPYILHFKNGICDSCDCRFFTDKEHELISAYNVTGGLGKINEYNGREELKKFVDICTENGLDRDYVNDFIDIMILTDFLITNTDRHWENFGVLRNPDTLEFESMAPLFDSGTSMLCRDPYADNRLAVLKIETHGIEKLQEDQLELVHKPDIIDLSLAPSKKEVKDFYVECGVNESHSEQISNGYGFKLDMLHEFQRGFRINIATEFANIGR
jgi:hypothetical protein